MARASQKTSTTRASELVDASAHVRRLYCKPGRIDQDHRMSSRNSSAFMRRRRRPFYGYTATSAPHFDTDRPGDGIGGQRHQGTKPSWFSMATLGAGVRIAIGLPLRSACLTHRCSMAALSPRARIPLQWRPQTASAAPTASALKCALWIRRRRRPVSITCSIVFT